ncbi:hypothetical protein C4546_01780 [Candidatus Parcubacteria bacterium]|jgi:DNA-directed RNA polymerase subunit RPC12/RpoP|nr:MAG: hypothetical protein C4546_01780 [Candidatus Parcubacteria bacterium]
MGFLRIFSKSKDKRKAECPYCSSALEKPPARKTKCPHCGKYIFVRTHPKNRERVVVTEEQAAAIDNEWLVQQTASDPSLGGEEEFYQEKEILQKRFGKVPSVSDIKWGLLNKRAGEAMKKSDFSALSGIYFQMALQKHEEGKDCHMEQAQAQKMQLMALKQNDVVGRVEIFSKDGCEECQKLNGKKFSVEEALKYNPLPVIHCTHKLNKNAPSSWCRCTYLPIVSDDVDLKGAWLGDK